MAQYDGGDFYKNYLLNVSFTGKLLPTCPENKNNF